MLETHQKPLESAPQPREVRLYIVRHGQTDFNEAGLVQGFIDSSLTDNGIDQAKRAGRALGHIFFTVAFSSDLNRQKDTAALILVGNRHPVPPLEELHGLREWCMGGFEGGLVKDLWIPVFREYNLADNDIAAGFKALEPLIGLKGIADAVAQRDPTRTAEDFNSIATRIHGAIGHIVAATLAKGGGNALVVSSGMTIRTIARLYAPDVPDVFRIPNCSLSVLCYADEEFSLLQVGDVSYLAEEAECNPPVK